MPRIAQHVTSYSQLAYFRLIDTDRQPPISPVRAVSLTPDVLLPILMRLLPIVVASLGLGVLVEVPVPQLTQGVAVTVALTRALIEQLSRRLFMLERGGDWARWKPHLEMLYLLRGKRPVVLGDEHFDAFSSWAAIIGEREAVRQWKVLSRGVTVDHNGQQRQLMDGDGILFDLSYYVPALLASASRLFPHHTFDPADPPTELGCWTYRTYVGSVHANYTSMAAFVLFHWLYETYPIDLKYARFWSSHDRDSAAFRRMTDLMAAPPSDAAQWGPGVAVFDSKRPPLGRKWPPLGRVQHNRLVVLGSEAMGDGLMALVRLTDSGRHSVDVDIFTNEPTVAHDQGGYVSIWSTDSPRIPYTSTHSAVMSVLGDHLGGMVWRKEQQR
mmetsp:Transcript_35442/g.101859  ORF Transcript_35442/g.101859 Transcript_35442/m.101859 type:complete len:384 (+) Transcript_35442:280-1431(+)